MESSLTNSNRQTPATVIRLPENTAGRDFCVGDIHGMYDLLEQLLASVNFDSKADRLISVGDLVDRGPASARALYYLNQSWFYPIRGNHEQMLIDCHENPDDLEMLGIWQRNGGNWWANQPTAMQHALYRRMRRLPLAMEVPTQRGMVGIVHADVPEGMNWQDFTAALIKGHKEITSHALWSRLRVRNAESSRPVEGIQEIYCGHNIVHTPVSAGNIHFIDTGAYLGRDGKLTIIDIRQGPDYRYSLASAK